MSEELFDEVEALNSIYGDGTLVRADEGKSDTADDDSQTYILQLPPMPSSDDEVEASSSSSSSLRLRFPPAYPASSPPLVLATHHSSGGRRGAGARDLALFRDVLAGAYEPGAVCLFDVVEEFARRWKDEHGAAAAEAAAAQGNGDDDDDDDDGDGDGDDNGDEEGGSKRRRGQEGGEEENDEDAVVATMAPPPWTLSDVVVDSKSVFVARVARVASPDEARRFVRHLLATDRRARAATHNVTAWRIRGRAATAGHGGDGTAAASSAAAASTAASSAGGAGAGGAATPCSGGPAAAVYQDCDDDGEAAAGGRLLHLMQVMGVWDAMVVVTRWYGGVKLGPRRFALMNNVARDGFVKAGLVAEREKETGGKKKKKGR